MIHYELNYGINADKSARPDEKGKGKNGGLLKIAGKKQKIQDAEPTGQVSHSCWSARANRC